MRILFDQAAHDMRNKGNNALLQAAMDRLLAYWPDASMDLITVAPNLAKFFFPAITPVNPDDLQPIFSRFDRLPTFVTKLAFRPLFRMREEVWHRWPERMPARTKHSNHHVLASEPSFENHNGPKSQEIDQGVDNIIHAISSYDLYVASGGGYFCDHDKWLLLDLFNRMDKAIEQGVPTVMVGQGIGPMTDAQLLTRAREILPSIDLLLYRNQRLGLPLLCSLDVQPERIIMTGDDAIEIAYRSRPNSLGNGIGVSLRVAPYTQVGKNQIEPFRKALQTVADKYKAELIAVPISSAPHESDNTYTRQVFQGYHPIDISRDNLETHHVAIKRAGRCRVMVAGTYHGAIFALAQGIPVVAVAKSTEYFNKLAELSDEFGKGCHVISFEDEHFEENLPLAIEKAWITAEVLRPSLLETSARLVEAQRKAYQRVFDLVQSQAIQNPMRNHNA